ncbi:MAG: serine/threonine protein kinase [Myxococcota bacterium]
MNNSKIKCLNCGKLNPPESSTCTHCKEQLSTKKTILGSDSDPAHLNPVPSKNNYNDDHSKQFLQTTKNKSSSPDKFNLIGKKLGEYEIKKFVRKGGMGVVYFGVHPLIGKKVAIKMLDAPADENFQQRKTRFLAEAKAVNAIGHPNIVDIFSFGTYKEGAQYFVMEYLEGKTLHEFLKQNKTLPPQLALSIFKQLLDGLKASHKKGIIHRDLKPDNIFLQDQASIPSFVKILDFGVAKFQEEGYLNSQTKSGIPVGTPYYMSPEQCSGKKVDQRIDIYSLGVIMYEAFTGERPWNCDSFFSVLNAHISLDPVTPHAHANIDPELEKIILWCLQKDKEDRPENIEELENNLIPVLNRLSQEESSNITKKPKKRRSTTTTAAGQVFLPNTLRWKIILPLLLIVGLSFFAYLFKPAFFQSNTAKSNKISLFKDVKITHPGKNYQEKNNQSKNIAKKKKEKIFIQLTGIPENAEATIKLNGKIHKGNLIQVDKNPKKKIHISVSVPGYKTWQQKIYPLFNQTLDVDLDTIVKKKKPSKKNKPRNKKNIEPKKIKKTLLDLNLI